MGTEDLCFPMENIILVTGARKVPMVRVSKEDCLARNMRGNGVMGNNMEEVRTEIEMER